MWKVLYHPEAYKDIKSLGTAEGRRILNAIEERIMHGSPDVIGKPLSYSLTGYRRIRVGDIRIIYKVTKQAIEVFVIAIGPRRDQEIYERAQTRVSYLNEPLPNFFNEI